MHRFEATLRGSAWITNSIRLRYIESAVTLCPLCSQSSSASAAGTKPT